MIAKNPSSELDLLKRVLEGRENRIVSLQKKISELHKWTLLFMVFSGVMGCLIGSVATRTALYIDNADTRHEKHLMEVQEAVWSISDE